MSESASLRVKCGQCGEKNALGRMFCSKCGARLEVSQATVKSSDAGFGGFVKLLGRLFRLAVSIALLFCIILLLRPASLQGRDGSAQEAQQLVHKLQILKTATLEGTQAYDSILESEVNAYLAELLKRSQPASRSGLQYSIKKINVAVTTNELNVVLHAACGPLTISYELVGVPQLENNLFVLDIQRARLGYMPLPKMAQPWLIDKVNNVFSKLYEEKSILDNLSTLRLEDGQIAVSTKGKR